MDKKILLVSSGWSGSSESVAQEIAGLLREAGYTVDVSTARKAPKPEGYQALVVGTAIHMGQVHPDVKAYLHKHEAAISALPTAYFVVCLTMKDDTEENRRTVNGYLDVVRKETPAITPASIGLFAGSLIYAKLSLPLRIILKMAKLEEGDYRDWDEIRRWSVELPEKLFPAA